MGDEFPACRTPWWPERRPLASLLSTTPSARLKKNWSGANLRQESKSASFRKRTPSQFFLRTSMSHFPQPSRISHSPHQFPNRCENQNPQRRVQRLRKTSPTWKLEAGSYAKMVNLSRAESRSKNQMPNPKITNSKRLLPKHGTSRFSDWFLEFGSWNLGFGTSEHWR